jgi:oligopeptide/dipeptide ABC transporter ATP-binding protein
MSGTSGRPLLTIEGLKVRFTTRSGIVQAARGVSLHVGSGETLGLVGESGSGKSVTVQAVLGLIQTPGEIVAGDIRWKGRSILGERGAAYLEQVRGKEISMIFQDPMTSLNPTMKVGNQVREVLHQHTVIGRAESRRRAVELMKLVGVPEPEIRIGQYPHEYSGGMRQRAMIAMAMANRPEILIADEPTTALDVTIQSQIFRLLRDLQRDFHTAIVLITHDLGVVAGMADRIVVMYAGRIMEEGVTEQIYYRPRHPYTAGLLKAVPSLADDEKQRLRTIEGTPPFLLKVPPGCPFAQRCEYAMRICREVEPPYHQTEAGNRTACWLYDPGAAGPLRRFEERDTPR